MGANAQTIVPTFTAGQVLTAAQQNQINTGVPVFATTITRDAAFGGAGEKTLAEGQMCYIEAAPQRFQVYNGTVWRDFDINANAYTPTFSNLTLGNGSINAFYERIGSYIVFNFHLSFGSTTSVTGLIGIGLPFTSAAGTSSRSNINVTLGDTGTNSFQGWGFIAESSTTVNLYALNVAGTYSSWAAAPTSATVPFTWTTNDEIYGTGIYRYL